MPYIGRPLNAGNLSVDVFTGNASTTVFTLTYSVGSSNSIGVYLDGVRQLAGTDFTASGTVLTFTTAPANLVGIDVYFLGLELSIPTPADVSVTAAKIASNAVTTAKIIDDAVTLAKMAPGTDGNIISYDASGNPVAIATGSDGQVLTSAGAGAPPLFESLPASGLTSKVITTSYNLATATGTVDYTGAGFDPSMIILFVGKDNSGQASWGMGNANADGCVYSKSDIVAGDWYQGNVIFAITTGAGNEVIGTVSAMITDGFRMSFSKGGSPTGSVEMKILMMK